MKKMLIIILVLFYNSSNAQVSDTITLTDYAKYGYVSETRTLELNYTLPIEKKQRFKSEIQIGYLTGFTKQGINPVGRQPIYGITLQKQFSKNVALESNVFYSQRMNGHKIQSDYLSFMCVAKAGYFGNRAGAYGLYGFSLNPSLSHANPENHTYGSLNIGAGAQIRLFRKTYVELKGYYDCGLSGAYLKDGIDWYDYRGVMVMGTLKFKL